MSYCIEELNEKYGVKLEDGFITVPYIYDEIRYSGAENLVILERNGLYGLANAITGEVVLNCHYNEVRTCYEQPLIVTYKDSKYGLVSKEGEIIADSFYDEFLGWYFEDEIFKLDGKFGILDAKGNEILHKRYDSIETFGSSLEAFIIRDFEKNTVFSMKRDYMDGVATYTKSDEYMLLERVNVNSTTSTGSPEEKAFTEDVHNATEDEFDYAWDSIKEDSKYEFPKETMALNFTENALYFSDDGREESLSKDYMYIAKSSNGYYGVIDYELKPQIPLIYDELDFLYGGYFYESHFKIKKDGFWGVCNNRGDFIQPCEFTGISHPYTFVMRETIFENEPPFEIEQHFLIVERFGNKGVVYFAGSNNFVIPCQYDSIDIRKDKATGDILFFVTKFGKHAVINEQGIFIEPFNFLV